MAKNNRDLPYSFLAIFLGMAVGFGSVKLLVRILDKNVLTSCPLHKVMVRDSVFGERLFCEK